MRYMIDIQPSDFYKQDDFEARRLPRLYASLATAYVILAGIAGSLLLALWTLTAHRAAWANANLLAFNPFAFALSGAAWRSRNGMRGGPFARTLAAVQVGAVFLGLMLHFLGGISQQNLPWLLFATPVWLAIAVGLTLR
jgi:hypothetical protein